jgi:HPr kinase/phosphorylase
MAQISVQQLFEENREKLGLEWIAGRAGGDTRLCSESVKDRPSRGLIGHLNFIHPFLVQVLGVAEINYLQNLKEETLEQAFARLFSPDLAAIIVANAMEAPPSVLHSCELSSTPLFTARVNSPHVIDVLRLYLAKVLAETTTLHGVFLDVLGMGVLVTGDSGIGKSELALELISRGHGLVADDVVELSRVSPETVEGRCPAMLRDFLEVRGLGMLNIRTIFGETAVRKKKVLKLIIHLEKPAGPGFPGMDRLPLNASTQEILESHIRKVVVPVAAGRNLAVLVEAAVRNYILQLRGIDSTREFIERHERQMTWDEEQ